MSPQDGFSTERIAGVCADQVRPGTYGSQGHEVTSYNSIKQIVKQKENEAPILTPPWVKDSSLGILIKYQYLHLHIIVRIKCIHHYLILNGF